LDDKQMPVARFQPGNWLKTAGTLEISEDRAVSQDLLDEIVMAAFTLAQFQMFLVTHYLPA
jgi:hypothetical protein